MTDTISDGDLTPADALEPVSKRFVPDGFVIVPIEPTENMLFHGDKYQPCHAHTVWRQMIEAARAEHGKDGE